MNDFFTNKESKSIGTKQQVTDRLAQQQNRYLHHPTRTAGEVLWGKPGTTHIISDIPSCDIIA